MFQWFIVRDGKEEGPFDTRQLIVMALKEQVVDDDVIRRSDKQSSTTASDIEGLLPSWLVLLLRDQKGPFTSRQLQLMILRAEVSEYDLLRRFDWLEWRVAESIGGVTPLLEARADLLQELDSDLPWYWLPQENAGYYSTSTIKELIREGKIWPDDLIAFEWDYSPWKFVRDVPFFDEDQFIATFPNYQSMCDLVEGMT